MHQIEQMQRSLGVDQVDKSRTPARLFFNPPCHRRTATEEAITKSGHGGSSGSIDAGLQLRLTVPEKDSDTGSASYSVTAWFHTATPEHLPG